MDRDHPRPSDADFQAQLETLEELESVENRLRWVKPGAIEYFLLWMRRRELHGQIRAWNRRFIGLGEDVEGHMERGA